MRKELVNRFRECMGNEAKHSFMDFGCVTPLFVY